MLVFMRQCPTSGWLALWLSAGVIALGAMRHTATPRAAVRLALFLKQPRTVARFLCLRRTGSDPTNRSLQFLPPADIVRLVRWNIQLPQERQLRQQPNKTFLRVDVALCDAVKGVLLE